MRVCSKKSITFVPVNHKSFFYPAKVRFKIEYTSVSKKFNISRAGGVVVWGCFLFVLKNRFNNKRENESFSADGSAVFGRFLYGFDGGEGGGVCPHSVSGLS
jgi:hypothetical protein